MKRIAYLLAALGTFALTSCQKVINVDIKDASPQYVIEGSITDAPGPYNIRITRSIELNKDNDFPAVSNALVVISDDLGHVDTLTQTTPGNYQTRTIQGMAGHAYTLNVFVDGQHFYTSSLMPQPVAIDSIYASRERHMGEESIRPVIVFRDPAGVHNYYRFRVFRDGIPDGQISILDDQFVDGQSVKQSFADMDSSFAASDNIRVELLGISKEMYEYYYSLQQTLMQSSATPANPIRRIQGENVIGYFSAHTISVKTLIMP
jgi:hypothetical protein